MKLTPTRLSACTFVYAAKCAQSELWISALILTTFLTSLVIHRPRPYFPNDNTIFDKIDPILAKCWWCVAIYKSVQKKVFFSFTMAILVVILTYLRTFFKLGSNIRYFIHVCLHICATMGTVSIYSTPL